MVEWTEEKIRLMPNEQIRELGKNAEKFGRSDITALCNKILAERKPKRSTTIKASQLENRAGLYVSEFHFVCPNELGVTHNDDHTIWTGTWVVAEENAKNAIKYGAQVALHSLKSEASYLQGTIIDWRKSPRERHYTGEQETQNKEGIDFLFQPSGQPLKWIGDGSGEKGYAWKELEVSEKHN